MEDKSSLPNNPEQPSSSPPKEAAGQRGDAPQSSPAASEQQTPRSTHPHPDTKVRLLAIALLIMLSLSFGFLGGRLGVEQNEPDLTGDRVALEEQGDLIGQIAQQVGESVVSVTPIRQVERSFFGPLEQEGAGTGIILTADGLIMTNRHVIPDNTVRVNVTLSDGTEYKDVEVLGRTGSGDVLDVAFLKIPDTRDKELKPTTIGDSSAVRVGDPVVAIGNALGKFQNTVTYGIISGHSRDVQARSRDGSQVSNLENVFQTDAAINEGNSGGPLVNMQGEVIGLNTAAVIEGAQDIGFAIPINDISGLIQSVKETGEFERPFIGVRYILLTNDVAEFYGLDISRGAYVAAPNEPSVPAVVPDSPAAQAGIQEGDIIIQVGDTAVDENNSLAALINRYAVGDTVSLTIVRGGEEMNIDVTLGAAPEE